MRGNVKVVVSTKKLRYELNLRRNITLIQGDSASGKTTLVQIVSDYLAGRAGPGTEVVCEKRCVVLSGDADSAIGRLRSLTGAVVFVDEQERFLYSKEFARAVLESDCYFVLITRDSLHMLPYSVTEIYCLKNSGYYQNTRQIYNSMEQIYPEQDADAGIVADLFLVEDSHSGYEMFCALGQDLGMACVSADGKSNISDYILKHKDKNLLAVVDGAAFGADMQDVMHALGVNKGSHVWTPESFEYLILKSGIVDGENLHDILESPGEYIESGEFSSWERFFTCFLERVTRDTIYAYNKSKLNASYLTKGNLEKMKHLLPEMANNDFL